MQEYRWRDFGIAFKDNKFVAYYINYRTFTDGSEWSENGKVFMLGDDIFLKSFAHGDCSKECGVITGVDIHDWEEHLNSLPELSDDELKKMLIDKGYVAR